jgi:hypothetical protein
MIKMFIGLRAKYPLFLTDFNETCIFFHSFSKNPQLLNFMKIRPVGTVFMRTDGWQTDRHDEANSRFSQFC